MSGNPVHINSNLSAHTSEEKCQPVILWLNKKKATIKCKNMLQYISIDIISLHKIGLLFLNHSCFFHTFICGRK